jgi:hypothetical protein
VTENPYFYYPWLIVAYGCLSHGLLLLVDGLYMDGWMVDSWQRNRNWKAMKRFFGEVGLPLCYYQHRLISLFPARIFVYRFIAFASTSLSALAIYYLSIRLGYFDHLHALLIALMFLSYSGYHMNLEMNVGLQYTLPTCIFYWAACIAFMAGDYWGPAHWVLHFVSLALFFISFNANSLLVYYFAFLALKFVGEVDWVGDGWNGILRACLENIDYIALPFVFWIMKEKFTPRHGHYLNYNRLRLNLPRLARGLVNVTRFGFEASISAPLRHAWESNCLWVALLSFGVAYFLSTATDIQISAIQPELAMNLLFAGILFFYLAALPYVLSGQSFSPVGWETRHHMLFHLPVSLILMGALSLIFSKDIAFAILITIMVINCVFLNHMYLDYIAVAAKERSWLHKLGQIMDAKKISVFWIKDDHPIRRFSNFPAYFFYMFEWLWGEKTRIGIEIESASWPPQAVTPENLIAGTTVDYEMEGVNVSGPHASLVISDGANWSPVKVAMLYLKERYLPGGDVKRVLEKITRLDYGEIQGSNQEVWRRTL